MKVALVCIAKNEDKYIHEWIDYHKKVGFDDIFIYQNDWEYKIEQKNVYTYQLNGTSMQIFSYNKFIREYKNHYDWAAFIDVDEFIVLKKHKNIKSFLENYVSHNGVAVNWVFFGDSGYKKVVDDNYKVLKRFTKRQNNFNCHIKTILKLNSNAEMISPHHCNVNVVDSSFRIFNSPFNYGGTIDIIQINHYFTKTFEEFEGKVARGRADIGGYRNISDYDAHNVGNNEIEDFTVLNFLKNKIKLI